MWINSETEGGHIVDKGKLHYWVKDQSDLSVFDLIIFQSSQNYFKLLLLKVWSRGWCLSMKWLLLVQGKLFIEMETKHLETFIVIWE